MSPQLPNLPTEATPATNELATKEAQAIANGRLRKHQRREELFDLRHRCMLWGVRGAAVAAAVIAAVWLFHMVAPPELHFVTEMQRRDLQTLLVAAMGTKLVTSVQAMLAKEMIDQ